MAMAVTAVPDSHGFDTIWVFDAAHSKRLKGATLDGAPLAFVMRYGEDLQLPERDALLADGWIVGLVFHVPRPGWQATPDAGVAKGEAMVAHARRLGWGAGATLMLDMEGLGDAGAPVMGYVRNVSKAVVAAGFRLGVYVGYLDGLLLAQLAQLCDEGSVDVLWSDYGQRTAPANVGFVCKQSAQTQVAGICIDPDRCYGKDARGGQLWGMALAAPPANDPQDVLPKVDPPDEPNEDPVEPAA